MEGLSKLNQHLLTDQVVDLFTKFGFGLEYVISFITHAANALHPLVPIQISAERDIQQEKM